MKSTPIIFAITVALGVLLLATNGCKNDDNTASTKDNVELSYTSSTEMSDVSGTLVLASVKILLKDIKLNVASSNDSSNFKTGPYVLPLNLNSSVNTIGSAFIPVGTYDKIKFEVHKLSDDEAVIDPDFVEGSTRFSVVVRGTYNGVAFIFKSDKSAKQKINFPNSLIVTETSSNVTLVVRPYVWFLNSSNGYLDPTNAANRSEIDNNIKDNIKASFKPCRDNNKDGIPD